jgi:hypothetical protein
MKRFLISFLLGLSLIGFHPIQNAAASGTLTQGDWSLVYPDFSKVGSETKWSFEVKANGSNQIFQTDSIWLEIFNSNEVSLGVGIFLQKNGSAKSALVDISVFDRKKLASSDLSKGFTVKLRIDRFRSLEMKGGTFTFLVPTLNFPKRPTQNNEFIKLNSDFSKLLAFPEDCTKVPFSYTMNDPFEDIDQVNFDIIDSKGKSLAGAYSYGYRSETVSGELSLCDYSLSSATGPFQFQIELEFDPSLNK